MTDQLKNIIIGAFVVIACVIVIFLMLFLHPSMGDEGQILHVRFSDIDKVNNGTRVTFAGKPVGEVIEILDFEDGRLGPKDAYGNVYIYELTLTLDTGVEVYDTDEITLRTSGLLGERSVAIIPKAPPVGVTPHLVQKDEIIYAVEAGSVEQTMKEFKEVADKVDVVLDNLNQTLDEIRAQELWKKIGNTAQNLSEITAALNKPEELSNIIDNVDSFTSEIKTRLPGSWDHLDEILKDVKVVASNSLDFTGNAKVVFADVRQGKGTAGKILVDEGLYLDLKAVLSKANTVADDVNHYGLLFHLDKGWQRLRARRMNLLQKLCTPQQFYNYFNDEIDQISTSISRVSMVLEKMSCYCNIMTDAEFTKVFADLLRRIEGTEEALKMYNQQLMECDMQNIEVSGDYAY